jgi:hypothetical protein
MAWITYNPNTGEITGTTIGSREEAEFNMSAGDSIMESATIPRSRVDKIVNGQIVEDADEVYNVKVEEVRFERDKLLAETDWMASPDRTITQAERDYRQALRDITTQEGFPDNVIWPEKP